MGKENDRVTLAGIERVIEQSLTTNQVSLDVHLSVHREGPRCRL